MNPVCFLKFLYNKLLTKNIVDNKTIHKPKVTSTLWIIGLIRKYVPKKTPAITKFAMPIILAAFRLFPVRCLLWSGFLNIILVIMNATAPAVPAAKLEPFVIDITRKTERNTPVKIKMYAAYRFIFGCSFVWFAKEFV